MVHLTLQNAPNKSNYVINTSSFLLPLRSNCLTSGGGSAGAFHVFGGKFYHKFRVHKMSQYNKIIDMETDNTYIFNLSEEDYLRASKGKIFFKYSFFR